MAASDDRFVPLGHLGAGPVIPVDCYRLYLELGERGFTMTTEAAGKVLVVQPPEKLTGADVTRLKRWRWHLLMMLDYFAKPEFDAHLYPDRPSAAPERRAS